MSSSRASLGNQESPGAGVLILNADDWGLDQQTTDRIWDCATRGRISSVSAMVFMEDSERAADLAREAGIDAGLHLNLTTPFSAKSRPSKVKEWQRQIVTAIRRYRLARAVFIPGLRAQFEYVVAAQLEEFQRLYGAPAARIDGHHHIHLCPNVLLTGLLPPGVRARRSFSYRPGEIGAFRRLYWVGVDRILARRHTLTDFFFSLPPLEPEARLEHIFSLARTSTVEVETHPALREEHDFLMGDGLLRWTRSIRMALPERAGKSPIAPA